jgi:antitoxin (DNA-binding transcriptional repressor) of toxin-antitoxin stability system
MNTTETDDHTAVLLQAASCLGQPQKFMAVRDARAEMRRMLGLAAKGSVILTTHGEPEAAVVCNVSHPARSTRRGFSKATTAETSWKFRINQKLHATIGSIRFI